eukprot:TRINITY_DN6636_c0_g1_i1.p5 TRINITY_DN6636_c0_g1~~TRINITY_DN6636_c0_g1_i1.p5  ORF type:complete len:70 (+),score=5.36 TRINITY_DN6636_c0_g1_i1:881-1090(+)
MMDNIAIQILRKQFKPYARVHLSSPFAHTACLAVPWGIFLCLYETDTAWIDITQQRLVQKTKELHISVP